MKMKIENDATKERTKEKEKSTVIVKCKHTTCAITSETLDEQVESFRTRKTQKKTSNSGKKK